MTTLSTILKKEKTIEFEKTLFISTSLLMSAIAVNFIPPLTGLIAYYFASKAKSSFLKFLAIISVCVGMFLGAFTAIM